MFVFLQLLSVLYRIVSKITISSPFVSIRIVSCDDRIVSSLVFTLHIHNSGPPAMEGVDVVDFTSSFYLWKLFFLAS